MTLDEARTWFAQLTDEEQIAVLDRLIAFVLRTAGLESTIGASAPG